MITVALTALGLFLLAGLAAFLYAAERAPEGYEDNRGFHDGVEPRPQALTKPPAPDASSRGRLRPCPPREPISAGQR
ncbi:MAG TPA: hypothetical protein VLW52_03860 [Opitutaceae bacterium]|nr:hypothetical protein [Opitutaceae bacterium]